MAKWALWAAHRYLEQGSNARTVGADGRTLRRPWREPAPAVLEEAKRRRAARAQPSWPRPLGWLLIGVAGLAVIGANDPIPSHGEVSVRPAPWLRPLQAETPIGPVEGVPPTFTWRAEAPPPFTFVLLDGSDTEVARCEDIGVTCYRPSGAIAAALGTCGSFAWYVESSTDGKPVRSLLAYVEIR